MEQETTKNPTRKSYSREFKLRAVRWYYANGENILFYFEKLHLKYSFPLFFGVFNVRVLCLS